MAGKKRKIGWRTESAVDAMVGELNKGWFTRFLNKVGLHTGSQVDLMRAAILELKEDFEYATDTYRADVWNPDKKQPTETDYIKATHHSPWYYAAVFMLSNTVAQLPWRFTIEKQDETTGEIQQAEPDEEFALQELFEHPDPVNKVTWYSLIEGTMQHLETCGNAYWLIFYDKKYERATKGHAVKKDARAQRDNPDAGVWRLRLLRPDKMTPKRDKETKALVGWKYKPGRKPTDYDINQIVHFSYNNPADDFQGLSPATPAWDSIEALRNFDRLNRVMIERDFEIGLTVEADKDAEIGPEERKALIQRMKQKHQGANKANEPFFPGPGITVKPTFTPKDIQFKELQEVMIRNVSASTGVPAALLGMTDQYNRANMKAIRKAFYMDTIMPKTRRIAEQIKAHLIPLIEPELSEQQGLSFGFDFSSVQALKEDPKDMAVALKHAVGAPWISRNEAREQLGLPVREDKPEYDELYTKPAPPAPVVNPNPAEPGKTPPGKEEEEEEEKAASDLEWFDPLECIDWKRAAAQPVEFAIWRKARKALGPIETKIIAEIHKRGKHEREEVMEELKRQWDALRSKGVIEKRGIYKGYFRKDGPIMPLHEFDAMFGELEKHLLDQDAWMFEVLREGADAAMLAGAELAAGALEIGFEFDLANPNVDLYKSLMGDRITFDIKNTTLESFKDSMYKGYELGEGISELSERVMNELGQLFGRKDWRAELIARTEANSAYNFGAMESYKQAGVEGTKYWISAFDNRVRDWHLDVQSVKGRDEPFIIFGPSGPATMMYPGDMMGGGENVCNCRCCVGLQPY